MIKFEKIEMNLKNMQLNLKKKLKKNIYNYIRLS